MTITSTTSSVTANGNGTATVFSFSPMTLHEAGDIEVILVDANGDETVLSEGTGGSAYALVVSSYPGTGSVRYPEDQITPIASGVSLVMRLNPTIQQDVNLKNQGRYFPDTLEKDVEDRQTRVDLMLKNLADRSLKFQASESNSPVIPNVADRADKFLGFNSLGDIIVSAAGASVSDLTSHTLIPDGTTVSRTLAAVTSGVPIWCGTAGGTADVLTATTTPVIDEYVTGLVYRIIAASTNATTTPTINIDSVGAKTMTADDGSSLPIGGIRAGQILDLLYDGTNMRVLNSGGMLDYCIATNSAGQTVSNITATALSWDGEVIDTRAWHDNSTNPTRMTVPAGVKAVRCFGMNAWNASATGSRAIWFSKNGDTATIFPGSGESAIEPESGTGIMIVWHYSGIMQVSEGDYFEHVVYQSSGGNLTTEAYSDFNRNFFGIEKVY